MSYKVNSKYFQLAFRKVHSEIAASPFFSRIAVATLPLQGQGGPCRASLPEPGQEAALEHEGGRQENRLE